MPCQNPQDNSKRYYSRDGGAMWAKNGKDLAQSWIPPEILCNDRARLVAWHPTNPNLAWGIGPGDIITRTANAGATFRWGNNDNNGIMTGGLFNFNAQNPDVLYFGSQDYNLWITFDGSKTTTQKAVNLAGAQVSLGGPADPNVLFCWNQRSADRGQTSERLPRNPFGCAGGEMASTLRVHPITRELFVGTDCYGTWKIGPPAGAKAWAAE